jgi:hypothetical protein
VANASSAPPPSAGGGAKYAVIGVVFVGLAIALIVFLTCDPEEPPAVAERPDAGPPSTELQPEDLELIENVMIDAGTDAGPGQSGTKIRYVYRQAECTGDIPRDAARRAVAENRLQVRNCYERALKTNHTLAGTINVQLVIGGGGQVEQVAVGGSLRDPTVAACVRRLATGWRMPAPTGGNCAIVSVPFTMTPQQ